MRKLGAWLIKSANKISEFFEYLNGISFYLLYHLKQKVVVIKCVLVRNEIKRIRRYDT